MKIKNNSSWTLRLVINCGCQPGITQHTLSGRLENQQPQTWTCPRCDKEYNLTPHITVEATPQTTAP